MILPLVSELLARVARRPVVEETFEALRRSGGEVRLAGLTDSAKALLIPLAFAELGRPTVLLVDTNQRAEALLEPVRYFYRAVTGKPGRRVAHLPAHEVLPYESRSPHAEISEDRAVALWRFATGDADLLIVPVQAAVWRMRDREFYSQLARTIARDESIPHEELIDFLSSAGYDKQITCEMPGQYAVRGGIIDIYSPESPQPVRVELLGDTIESIRAFDPNTQRSTNPVERATLLPLTEYPRHAEVLERARVSRWRPDREDDAAPGGFYPGWEFREALRENRKSTLFDLTVEPLIIADEPSLLAASIEKYRAQLAEAFRCGRRIRWPSRPTSSFSMMKNGIWRCRWRRAWRSSIWASRRRIRWPWRHCRPRRTRALPARCTPSPPRAITETSRRSSPKRATASRRAKT